jgi:NitT/TauT family transport system ATP-binding protein
VLRGVPVDDVPDGLAVVLQDYGRSLYPWLSVRDNVAMPLRRTTGGRAPRRKAADAALAAVGLPDAGDKYPWQLSGGMQQRVAITRALACEPLLLLMDEPFGSVDAQTREDLEDLVLGIRRERDITIQSHAPGGLTAMVNPVPPESRILPLLTRHAPAAILIGMT